MFGSPSSLSNGLHVRPFPMLGSRIWGGYVSGLHRIPVSVKKHSSWQEEVWENEPSELESQGGETSFCCRSAGQKAHAKGLFFSQGDRSVCSYVQESAEDMGDLSMSSGRSRGSREPEALAISCLLSLSLSLSATPHIYTHTNIQTHHTHTHTPMKYHSIEPVKEKSLELDSGILVNQTSKGRDKKVSSEKCRGSTGKHFR